MIGPEQFAAALTTGGGLSPGALDLDHAVARTVGQIERAVHPVAVDRVDEHALLDRTPEPALGALQPAVQRAHVLLPAVDDLVGLHRELVGTGARRDVVHDDLVVARARPHRALRRAAPHADDRRPR